MPYRARDRPIGRAQYSRRTLVRHGRSCEPVVSANSLVGVICMPLGSYRRRTERPRLYKIFQAPPDYVCARVWGYLLLPLSCQCSPLVVRTPSAEHTNRKYKLVWLSYIGYSFVSSCISDQIRLFLATA